MKRFFTDYGMIFALLLLCVLFSLLTLKKHKAEGEQGGEQLAATILADASADARVLILAIDGDADRAFTAVLEKRLTAAGRRVLETVHGSPQDGRQALDAVTTGGLDVIACTPAASNWLMLKNLAGSSSWLAKIPQLTPKNYWWPVFLNIDNLLNVANQIVVIAIIAIGMTLVIITAGIDLSVGSLIAFSAVIATYLIRDHAGAEAAGAAGIIFCCLAAILACAALGLFSGSMVTLFNIPPFIVTLGMMMVASGLAFIIAQGQSISESPQTFTWLGRGTAIWKIPNSVVLLAILYAIAHIVMSKTTFGRYVYAIGGNPEAARLSGVPVKRIIVIVYGLCGALAGLGGVIIASQLKSGSATYGVMYELYVIAAVVVGGTSLMGGQGKIFGTLIGAFIIAVIRNGMNLTEVSPYSQKVVLGLVILAAVLFDQLKHHGLAVFKRRKT